MFDIVLSSLAFEAIILTLIFNILDWITGVIKAIYLKELSSKVMRQGLFHKVSFWLAVLLGIAVDVTVNYIDIGIVSPILYLICGYIIICEIISIIENLKAINPKLGTGKFLSFFNLHEEAEETIEKDQTEENSNDNEGDRYLELAEKPEPFIITR